MTMGTLNGDLSRWMLAVFAALIVAFSGWAATSIANLKASAATSTALYEELRDDVRENGAQINEVRKNQSGIEGGIGIIRTILEERTVGR